MILTVEAVEMMAKRIRTARAAQDHAAIDELTAAYAAMGVRLHLALQRYGDRIVEAACCNNAQRLWSYTSRRRGRTPVAIPAAPAAFSASLPSARSWGWGVASVSPQPVFWR
jgi:hypothetical protein